MTSSILSGLTGLYILATVALVLTLTRSLRPTDPMRIEALVRLFLAGIAIQCLHTIEEYLTGFHVLFPRFLGLLPWPADFFVVFNLSWIAVWILSAIGILKNYRIALFPAWFFALAMLANLVAHPLLAIYHDGYFPGLFTSPLAGFAGFFLLRRLFQRTKINRRQLSVSRNEP